MEQIIDFVKEYQPQIAPTRRIILRFGKPMDTPHILDCRCSPQICRDIVSNIGKNTSIKYTCEIENVYCDHEMEYVVGSKSDCNYSKTILECSHPIEGVRAMLQDTDKLLLEEFPTRMEYHDEFKRSRHIFDYGELVEIHFITEEREGSCIHMIEMHITKHNLYGTPLFDALHKVIPIITSTFSQSVSFSQSVAED
jgi:hypothetical protein